MAFLDLIVDGKFRRESAGLVVVFPGGRRHLGYLVKSATEELKIRSFLKMFYFAHVSILSLGYLLAVGLSRELSYALGRRETFVFRIGATLGMYSLVAGVPDWLLWRSYKKGSLSFVSVEDAVVVSGKNAGRHWILSAGLFAVILLLLLGIMLLIRGTSTAN